MTARSLAEQALELAEKAYDSPWTVRPDDEPGNSDRYSVVGQSGPGWVDEIARIGQGKADAEFIAFARSALPALAERCLALEAEIRRLSSEPGPQ